VKTYNLSIANSGPSHLQITAMIHSTKLVQSKGFNKSCLIPAALKKKQKYAHVVLTFAAKTSS